MSVHTAITESQYCHYITDSWYCHYTAITSSYSQHTLSLLLVSTHCHYTITLQGDKDLQDALNRRLFSAKEPLIIGLFGGECPIEIRHSMTLRHPLPYFHCTIAQMYNDEAFAKEPYRRDDILQKRPIILRSLLNSKWILYLYARPYDLISWIHYLHTLFHIWCETETWCGYD